MANDPRQQLVGALRKIHSSLGSIRDNIMISISASERNPGPDDMRQLTELVEVIQRIRTQLEQISGQCIQSLNGLEVEFENRISSGAEFTNNDIDALKNLLKNQPPEKKDGGK